MMTAIVQKSKQREDAMKQNFKARFSFFLVIFSLVAAGHLLAGMETRPVLPVAQRKAPESDELLTNALQPRSAKKKAQ
jgi:hypothetical protein